MATGTQIAQPAGGGATFDATTGELSGRAGIVCVCMSCPAPGVFMS